MERERRRLKRQRSGGLSYIQFEAGGGGIVLNASEDGLAFHAAATVRQPGSVRISVSPNPEQRMELTSEIVWMDESGKSGGLRFTGLTAETREQIHAWLGNGSESEISQKKFALPACAAEEATDVRVHARREIANLPPVAAVPHDTDPATSMTASTPSPASYTYPPPRFLKGPASREQQFFAHRSQLLRGIATAFLICVFVFVPLVFIQSFRLEIGSSLIRLGEKLRGNGAQQSQPSTPALVQDPAQANAPSVSEPGSETSSGEISEKPIVAPPTQSNSDAPSSDEAHLPRPHHPLQTLKFRPSSKGRSPLVQRLWSEVGAGDVPAEVSLAQLYLRGDGVPKNCEQARVLLKAASRSGNAEATQQLKKLNESSCR